MTCALVTLFAPSVKATAPAALSNPISAISSPRMPLVSAAIGWTWTIAVSRARRSTKSTMAGSSIAGLVSGCDTMVVTPPAAAAWLAEANVSRYSAPGSPTKARMSMSPGATTLPRQSITSVPSGTPAAPMPRLASRTTPSAIRRSPSRSRSRDGSMIRALVSRIGRRSENISRIRQIARQRLEHRHAHGDAHLDLLADQGLGAVGDAGVDLDAAVHRTRMHHQRIGLGVGELPLVEAEIGEILLGGGHQRTVHALALQAQHHHDVGVAQSLAHVTAYFDAEVFDAGRQQGGRGHHPHARAQRVEQDDVGARHARVGDVAADCDRERLDRSLVAAYGQRIEQGLGRMLVGAVAHIDHRAIDLAGQQFDRAGSLMADHQDVGAHGIERDGSVDQRLALAHGRRNHRHVHDVGAEPLAGEFER